jgi:hypothetical protein
MIFRAGVLQLDCSGCLSPIFPDKNRDITLVQFIFNGAIGGGYILIFPFLNSGIRNHNTPDGSR